MINQPEGLQKELLLLTPECRRWVLEQAAEIERLRKALEPFVRAGREIPEMYGDFQHCVVGSCWGEGCFVSVGDCREAAEASGEVSDD